MAVAQTNSKPGGAGSGASVSQNELAYAVLQQKLTTLEYKPGDYLNISSLMEDVGLGRTPINQALHRLANEGLVVVIPRKGIMVAPLSLDDAMGLIEVRLANECLCMRLAAARIRRVEVDALHAIVAQFEAAVAGRDMAQVMALDRSFHEKIAAIAGNPLLMEILKVLHARSQRFWALSLASATHLEEVQAEHREICRALAANDGQAAEAATRAHIESFRRSLLRQS